MAAGLYVLSEEALRQVLEALALALQGEEEDGVPDGGGGVVQPQHLHRAVFNFVFFSFCQSETACSIKINNRAYICPNFLNFLHVLDLRNFLGYLAKIF